MAASPGSLAGLAVAWLAYGLVHSLLADRRLKARIVGRWPGAARAYRLAYNGLAVVLLAGPLALTRALRGPPLWDWPGAWGWLADGLAAAALAVFLWSLRYYDLGVFLGLRQWREGAADPDGPQAFRLSPLHRFVRHPWYSCALVLIWTRDWDPAWLVTAAALTAYIWVGLRLEEAKLETAFGDAYRRYRARVPALLPRPWRYLDRAQACTLGGPG